MSRSLLCAAALMLLLGVAQAKFSGDGTGETHAAPASVLGPLARAPAQRFGHPDGAAYQPWHTATALRARCSSRCSPAQSAPWCARRRRLRLHPTCLTPRPAPHPPPLPTAYSGEGEKDKTGFNACQFGGLSGRW